MQKGLSSCFSWEFLSWEEGKGGINGDPLPLGAGEKELAKAAYLRRRLLAAFPFNIFAELVDPVGLGELGSFRAGSPASVFGRTVQDDNDHLYILRVPFFFLGAGGNLFPKFGIEF
jgi:hypothetical protein